QHRFGGGHGLTKQIQQGSGDREQFNSGRTVPNSGPRCHLIEAFFSCDEKRPIGLLPEISAPAFGNITLYIFRIFFYCLEFNPIGVEWSCAD
ncbi:MAG: hypothetical protein L0Y38_06220, partial [Methylococcaceae bacterium]|nr:hypothetical protein [Methylococcaceae bacterium]